MKKFLLDYGLKVRLPIIIFVIISTFAVTYYVSYAERNGIGYQPEQPIKYSHKIHAGDMKIDCKYCHVGVEKSRVASVPSVNICMGCHATARTDIPEIIKLKEYYDNNRPVPWKRVYKLPDFAYFNHSVHVNKGVECQSCHGDSGHPSNPYTSFSKFGASGVSSRLYTHACLNCHSNIHGSNASSSRGQRDFR